MRFLRTIATLCLALAMAGTLAAQTPKKKRVLCIGQSKGFQHDTISHGLATIWKLGQVSGL